MGFDGVYNRFNIETANSQNYQILLYSIPEESYNEVLQYQLIDSDYNDKDEKIYDKIPDDKDFNEAKAFIYGRYK